MSDFRWISFGSSVFRGVLIVVAIEACDGGRKADDPPDGGLPPAAENVRSNGEEAWDLVADDGVMRVATLGGLFEVDATSLELRQVAAGKDQMPTLAAITSYRASDGTLWVGTLDAGLWSFDGATWTGFAPHLGNFPSVTVYAIAEHDGAMWFATFDGLVRREGGVDQVFTTASSGLPNNTVLTLHARGDELWVGTVNGLAVVRDGTFTRIPLGTGALESIGDIASDAGGAVWVGSLDGLFKIVDREIVAHYNGDSWGSTTWVKRVEAIGNDIYFATADSTKLTKFDGTHFVDRSPADGGAVAAIAVGPSGKLWIATKPLWGAGFDTPCNGSVAGAGAVFRLGDTGWERVALDRQMPRGLIDVVIQRRNGDLVAAGNQTGISERVAGAWTAGQLADDLRDRILDVRAIVERPDGKLLAGGWCSGLMQRDGDVWRSVTDSALPLNQNGGHSVAAMTQDPAGHVWAGFGDPITGGVGMLAELDGTTWRVVDHEPGYPHPGEEIYAVAADAAGNLWVGGLFGGLWQRTPAGAWHVLDQNNTSLPHAVVADIQVDATGRLWLGTPLGLYVFDPMAGDVVEHYTRATDGLPSDQIYRISLGDDGTAWVATFPDDEARQFATGGVGYFDGQAWKRFDRSSSDLPSNHVGAIARDGDGAWAGFGFGVVHLNVAGE